MCNVLVLPAWRSSGLSKNDCNAESRGEQNIIKFIVTDNLLIKAVDLAFVRRVGSIPSATSVRAR